MQRAGGAPLDQEDVDRLLGATRTARGTALPKGLSERTLEMVSTALRRSGEPLSAEDVAAELGMARVSARRYLEHLVNTGAARVRPRYGQAGRPRNLYTWTG